MTDPFAQVYFLLYIMLNLIYKQRYYIQIWKRNFECIGSKRLALKQIVYGIALSITFTYVGLPKPMQMHTSVYYRLALNHKLNILCVWLVSTYLHHRKPYNILIKEWNVHICLYNMYIVHLKYDLCDAS